MGNLFGSHNQAMNIQFRNLPGRGTTALPHDSSDWHPQAGDNNEAGSKDSVHLDTYRLVYKTRERFYYRLYCPRAGIQLSALRTTTVYANNSSVHAPGPYVHSSKIRAGLVQLAD